MNRRDISGHNLESEAANLFLFREWDEAFLASYNATKSLTKAWEKEHSSWREISTVEQFNKLYRYFMENFRDHLPEQAKRRFKYWRPASGDLSLNLTRGGRWNNDSVFGQERLVGVNPVQIQRVTLEGRGVGMTIDRLRRMLSGAFDWDQAVRNVTGLFPLRRVSTHIPRKIVLTFVNSASQNRWLHIMLELRTLRKA